MLKYSECLKKIGNGKWNLLGTLFIETLDNKIIEGDIINDFEIVNTNWGKVLRMGKESLEKKEERETGNMALENRLFL